MFKQLKFWKKGFMLAAALSTTISAEAAPIAFYETKAAFLSSLKTTIIDDYENPKYGVDQTDSEMSNVLGETRYRATGHLNRNYVTSAFANSNPGYNYYCSGCNGSYVLDFTSTSISTTNGGVFGVGFDFFNSPDPGNGVAGYNAFITFGDGSQQDIVLPLVTWTNFREPGFFGVTSIHGIRTIALGLAGGSATVAGSFGQDNLIIGRNNNRPVDVPEPNLLMLLVIGALLLAATRMRDPRYRTN